jgi:Ca2+/Na+ antiporter
MTMARKGLANMAMTACFAGPVFNILIGLGLGLSSAAAHTGNAVADGHGLGEGENWNVLWIQDTRLLDCMRFI